MAPPPPPDPDLVDELRGVLLLPKRWISLGEIPWVDAGGRPKGYKFREHLALDGGLQPATLYMDGYYKESTIEGSNDKLSLCLFYKNKRILGIDDDGPSRHRNEVGVGRPYFQQTINHPHIHTISDDSFDGYAEPIQPGSQADFWALFLAQAAISGAPPFGLPPEQRELIPR